MKKKRVSIFKRAAAFMLAVLCVVGLLPSGSASAVDDSISLESFGKSQSYKSAELGSCMMHEMYFNVAGQTLTGFCASHGASMSKTLVGQTWGKPTPVTDPTIEVFAGFFYSNSTHTYTDKAKSMGLVANWSDYVTWYMNAIVQAIIWRCKEGTMDNPVEDCAEEMMYVFNAILNEHYTSIDDKYEGISFRDWIQNIITQGTEVWGDWDLYEYTFTGPGNEQYPASSVQPVIAAQPPEVIEQSYNLTIKKVDAASPSTGLAGARFNVKSQDGNDSRDVYTGADGTATVRGLEPGTYTVTELAAPDGYAIDDSTPRYVTVPNGDNNTVTVTFTDTRKPDTPTMVPANGSIRKVDADDPTKGLAGAVIKIEGVDNGFTGTYTTVEGGYISDIPWDTMPIGSYTATEVTPPEGYTISSDPDKVKQSFVWDGANDVSLVFEDDAKVKVKLLKQDESGNPIAGVVFNIFRDSELIGSEATDAQGTITVGAVTEGLYAFVEVAPAEGYNKLTWPVIAHVDQATIQGGGTVTVTAVNNQLPGLRIEKYDRATGTGLSGVTFRVWRDTELIGDFITDANGQIYLDNLQPGTYQVQEVNSDDDHILDTNPQQVELKEGGGTVRLVFFNDRKPGMRLTKLDSETMKPLADAKFRISKVGGAFVQEFTTDASGTIDLSNLEPGTYEVVETAAPNGYLIDNAKRVIELVPGANAEFVFTDTRLPDLKLIKTSSDGTPLEGVTLEGTTTPLKGVTFLVTDSSGRAIGRSNGEYITDENGRIVINDLTPGTTVVAREIKTPDGYVLDSTPKTILLKSGEVNTLRFYNRAAGTLVVVKLDKNDKTPLEGVEFEITYSDGRYVDADYGRLSSKGLYRTDANGEIRIPGIVGTVIVTETKPLDGYIVDEGTRTQTVQVNPGDTQTIVVYNTQGSSALIHKTDSVTSRGIYGVTFLLSDAKGNPIGTWQSDNNGYVYIDKTLKDGKYTIREIECAEGYILDTVPKTVYIQYGGCETIIWKNTPITGQIQITKTSADYNINNGWPAGTALPGVEFEIYDRAGNLVDTVKTDKNGVARSKPLPLGRYKIVESKTADFYALDKTPIEVEIEFAGQIVKAAMTNKSTSTNVSITKRGYKEVMPGQTIRYDFSDIGNNSSVALESFYWRDTLPIGAVRLATITTGTWNAPGNYKIVYKTNLSSGYRLLADNLSTARNHTLDASPAALGLANGEAVTEFMAVFGVVPAGFRQVEAPKVTCTVLQGLANGVQFTNVADVGGVYNNQWVMAVDRWVTTVYTPTDPTPLPRTGY